MNAIQESDVFLRHRTGELPQNLISTVHISGGGMLTREAVVDALRECYDPEIPVNIVDLGLVYEIRVNDSQIEVDFTLTAPGCGMAYSIRDDIHAKLSALEGVGDVKVNIVWEPLWTPDRMSDDAKKALGFG